MTKLDKHQMSKTRKINSAGSTAIIYYSVGNLLMIIDGGHTITSILKKVGP